MLVGVITCVQATRNNLVRRGGSLERLWQVALHRAHVQPYNRVRYVLAAYGLFYGSQGSPCRVEYSILIGNVFLV